MGSKWIVDGHHIAIESGNDILHPTAEEVYSFVAGENQDILVSNPMVQMSNVRFSKIGAPLKCEIYADDNSSIILDVYTIRKGQRYSVDIIDGYIIDHCCVNGEWFYLNGDIATLQGLLQNAEIKANGEITTGQYLKLIKQEFFSEHKYIDNLVPRDILSKRLVVQGKIPDGIHATLYEYQKKGFNWMRNMLQASQGCILGDEMGLGKTLQVITVFADMKKRGNTPMLVVAPVSLLENWKRECDHFAPDLDVLVHHGSKRTGRATELKSHDVVVISYNTAVSDLSMLKMINWTCVVLDEAQNIKNPSSERAKSVKAFSRQSSIAVTGTPFENHITDIWSLVDFVVPGLLGTLSTFKNNVSDDVLGAEKIEPVLSPIMIRRLVKDVANDLPEKIVIPQAIVMSDYERENYERYRMEAKNSIDSGKAVSLAVLQKLRMFCTHQWLCEDISKTDPAEHSIKYQRFCEIIEEIISRNEKVIVFTSYKKMFDIFMEDIPKRYGIEINCINGDTPVEERQKIVDWFNNFEGSVMLALNPRAAGTGLNITGANHVIHYNLEWNPSLEDQSSARAYRRGQKKNVFIYRLYYADTVEQIVNERIERKREIASTAIVGTDGAEERNDILRALEIAPEFS